MNTERLLYINSYGGCGSVDISHRLLRGFLDDEFSFFVPIGNCHTVAFINRTIFRLIRNRKGKETRLEAVH